MHEKSLIRDLLNQIEMLTGPERTPPVVKITIQIGALAGISPDHFRYHFERESAGTIAEHAELQINYIEDTTDPRAPYVHLKSLEVTDEVADEE